MKVNTANANLWVICSSVKQIYFHNMPSRKYGFVWQKNSIYLEKSSTYTYICGKQKIN